MRRLVILSAAVSLVAACGGGGGGGPVLPGAPGTPTFTNVLGTGLRVNWTAATGADSYKVERAPDVAGAPGTWAQAASGVTVLHFDDGGLTASTSYWYRVRGTNGAGDGAYSAAGNVTTAAAGPPLGIWDQTNWDQSLWQ